MRSKPENALAQVVARWFRNSNWDVYEEVRPSKDKSQSCDIVAVETGTGSVRMVEAKMALTDIVVDQAIRWLNYGEGCYVAVPWIPMYLRGSRKWKKPYKKLDDYGVGLILVKGERVIRERDPDLLSTPENRQRTIAAFSKALRDTGLAGTSGGKISASRARIGSRSSKPFVSSPG